jgi:predicted Zn-dependent protease
LDPQRAQAIRRDLTALEQALRSIVSPNSLVALRVGFLAREGLIHDARLSLTAALTKDPDEPTLHLLLGNLYLKAGLPEMAAESFDEAQFLLTRSAGKPPALKK